ncbi:MAG TPA: BON domain-containing protein [Opitutaceae bacterium]|nr:BON domain-containing protein [Opitutaceae bacterium]
MKNALFSLLFGAVLGALALYLYNQHEAEQRAALAPTDADPAQTNPPSSPSFSDKIKDAADKTGDAISDKLAQWHLTPDDIKKDLAQTGEVVRTKAQSAGEKIDDARIVTVVKAKFVLDRDLSALDIHVESRNGAVTLGGTVAAPGLIGKAIVLTLDTDGVRSVDSKLRVGATP